MIIILEDIKKVDNLFTTPYALETGVGGLLLFPDLAAYIFPKS